MTPEKAKQFLLDLGKSLKSLETDTLTYLAVVEMVRLSGRFPELDQALAAARITAEQMTAKKYDPAKLEAMFQQKSEANLDQDLLQLLRDWQPTSTKHQ